MLGLADAAGYVRRIGRERHGSPDRWTPILTPEEIEALDRPDDGGER